MPQILFAGYKVPHPLHPYFTIKIQTDGSVTPQEVLEQACTRLIAMMGTLENKFKREFRLGEADGAGNATVDLGINDPYGTGGVGAWGANAGGGEYEDF
jgi:DNA-directed RNA polymerase II subunit RPB11